MKDEQKLKGLFHSFRVNLIVLVVFATCLPVLLVSYPLVKQLSSLIKEKVTGDLELSAIQIVDRFEDEISRTKVGLQTLSGDGDIVRSLKSLYFIDQADNKLSRFQEGHQSIAALFLVDQKSQPVSAAPLYASEIEAPSQIIKTIENWPTDPLLKHRYQAFISVANFQNYFKKLSEKASSKKAESKIAVYFIYPLKGVNSEINGYLVALIPVRRLYNLAEVVIPEKTDVFVKYGEENILGRSKEDADYVKASALWRIQTPQKETSELAIDVVVAQQSKVAFAELSNSVAGSIVLILIVVLFMMWLSILFGRRLVKPINKLERVFRQYDAAKYHIEIPDIDFIEFQEFLKTLRVLGERILNHIESLKNQEREKLELERSQIRSELDALRKQMSPHFLFNSLNSILTMISIDQNHAAEMIQKLASLYRLILDSSKQTTATVDHEIKIVEGYLALEKMRFGDRLHYLIKVDEKIKQKFIPTLVLQTLVENSIKHGISKSRKGGEVKLEINPTDEGFFEVELTNSGALYQPKKDNGTGTGIKNTVKRLQLLYGEKAAFYIGKLNENMTIVRFHFTGERL